MYKQRRKVAGLVAGILVLALLIGLISSLAYSVSAASSSEIRDEIDSLQQQADDISARQDELNQQIAVNKSDTQNLIQQKSNLDQQIELTQEEINNKQAQIQEYNNLIAAKQSELDDVLQQESDLYDQYKLRIRAMEENGDVSYWQVLFSSTSFADLLDRITMISEIAQSDQIMLSKLEAIAEEISTARADLETEKASLQAAQDELKQSEETMQQQRDESDALIQELLADQELMKENAAYYDQLEEELVAQIAAKENDYDDAVASEQAAAAAAAAAAQQQGSSGGSSSGDGSSSAPASGGWYNPLSYLYVTCAYGYRIHPITGAYSFHSGVDLSASVGQNIFAAKGGTVTEASYSSVYGYYVVINHGDGFSTLYGHMTNYAVYAGQSVSGGQVIGYAGSTGWSTGPHLHFTVYYNGSTVNPMAYIG